MLIDWDYSASGIWWVSTKQEHEAPAPQGAHWTATPPPGWDKRPRAWSDQLTGELLDDLQAWNDSWDHHNPDLRTNEKATVRALQERGRELAVRVQDELGTDGWEVLYKLDGQIVRVHPPGNWPARTWLEDLLGYAPRGRKHAEEEARIRQKIDGPQQASRGISPHTNPDHRRYGTDRPQLGDLRWKRGRVSPRTPMVSR